MGLLTGYLLYRAGRKREERDRELEEQQLADELDLVCDNCGFTLGYHVNDVRRSCPTHVLEIRESNEIAKRDF
jgi:hypothetical protein